MEKIEKKVLGAGALHLFSLERRWLQVDIVAACQHQQGGYKEDDQALHNDSLTDASDIGLSSGDERHQA